MSQELSLAPFPLAKSVPRKEFLSTLSFIRLKENVRRRATYVWECHQQAPCEFPAYISGRGPYSQSASHSWQGSGGDRPCLVVYKSQSPGTRQWVPAHPTGPHTAVRQPNTPAGSAEGAGAEMEFYLFGKHSNTMEMKAAEAPR